MDDKYKTFWPRFWAGFMDGIALMFISGVIYLLVPNAGFFKGFRAELLVGTPTLYFTICHWRWGQTWGKKLNAIVVLDVSEKKLLSFPQSLSREIAGWLEMLNLMFPFIGRLFPLLSMFLTWLATLWFPLEVITMLSNKKRRALHDFLARSVVVRQRYVDWSKLKGHRFEITS